MRHGTIQHGPVYRRRFFSFLYGMEAARDGVPITNAPDRVHNGRYRTDRADWEDGWRSLKIAAVKKTS